MTEEIIKGLEGFYDERRDISDKWDSGEFSDEDYEKEKTELFNLTKARLSEHFDIQKLLDELPHVIKVKEKFYYLAIMKGHTDYVVRYIYDRSNPDIFCYSFTGSNLSLILRQLKEKLKENNLL